MRLIALVVSVIVARLAVVSKHRKEILACVFLVKNTAYRSVIFMDKSSKDRKVT